MIVNGVHVEDSDEERQIKLQRMFAMLKKVHSQGMVFINGLNEQDTTVVKALIFVEAMERCIWNGNEGYAYARVTDEGVKTLIDEGLI